MKNITLFIFFLLPAVANAQFNKGDAFLGGTLSGSFNKNSGGDDGVNTLDYSNRSIGIAPIAGFFISDRFALGGKLEFDVSKNMTESPGSKNSTMTKNYVAGAMGRYFFPLSEKFLFALTGNIYYSRNHLESKANDDVTNDIKSYAVGLTVKPTFLYFPSKRWGFEANIGSIGYTHFQDLSRDMKNDTFQATYGSISLGVSYYIRK